jgi:D-3-phosphoglycerate dehydrogenase
MSPQHFKVVVTDQVFPSVDIERDALTAIGARLEVADGTPEGVLRLGSDADGLLNTYMPITQQLLGGLPHVKIVARYGIGVDNVDVEAASAVGVTVTNVPDYSVEEVAAHALALMLSLIRRLPQADTMTRSGGWGIRELRPIARVSSLTFGLLGFGRIARRLAESLWTLGGQVLAYDPYVREAPRVALVTLDELLARSDVISVHAPLTEETRGLVDARFLAKMRPGGIIVNTSRGPLVALDDVIDALRSGHLRAAGLDVFDKEPLDPQRVAGVPNLLVTPHMAYYSEQSLQESQRKAVTQVIKVLQGQAPDYPVRR